MARTPAASLTLAPELLDIPFDQLRPSPENVRSPIAPTDPGILELADSIAAVGLLTPPLVRPYDEATDSYEIIAGYRRWLALTQLVRTKRMLPTDLVRCTLSTVSDDADVRVMQMLIENLQREEISPVDEARGFTRLVTEFGIKQAEVAAKVGRTPSHITKRMALLRLPDIAQAMVNAGTLPLAAAYEVTKIHDDKRRERTVDKMVKNPSMAEYTVQDAIREEKTAADAKKLTDWLAAHGIETVKTPAWGEERRELEKTHRAGHQYSASSITNYAPKKGDVVTRSGSKDTTVMVWSRLTKAEREAATAAIEAGEDAPITDAEIEEIAKTNPLEAWELRCSQLEEAHGELVSAYQQRRSAETVSILTSTPGKTLAKIVLEHVVSIMMNLPGGQARNVVRKLSLGSPVDFIVTDWQAEYDEAKRLLTEFIDGKTDRALAVYLAGYVTPEPASDTFEKLIESGLAALGLEEPGELELPPEPWRDAEGNWVTDRERPEDAVPLDD